MNDDAFDMGRFRTVSVLHRGAYSSVFVAHDIKTNERVALKVLPLVGDHHEIGEAMFRKEVEALDGFEHCAVVRMRHHFLEHEPPRAGIVFDLVPDGLTLAGEIARASRPTLRWRIEQLTSLLDGLDAAHRRGVIHRDVKLTNILFDRPADVLRLADFGIARVLAAYARPDPGVTLRQFHSRPYAAPEQVLGGDVSFSADMHAFGVVMAAMFAWRVPSEDFTVERLAAFLEPMCEDVSDPGLTGEVRNLIEGLLHASAAQRPRAPEVARVLQLLIERAAERCTVPVGVTHSARSKAQALGFRDFAAVIDDFNTGLRVRYESSEDRRTGTPSFAIRLYGANLQAVARPGDDDSERLMVVDIVRSQPGLHARDRARSVPAPFQVSVGAGSARELINAAYVVWAEEALRLEERRKKESLLKVATFVLERQRAKMSHFRIRYRFIGRPSNRRDGRPPPREEGPSSSNPKELQEVAGDFVAVQVRAVTPWDSDGSETDLAASEWTAQLDREAQFSCGGKPVGTFHAYDHATRTLTIRKTDRERIPREGDLEYKDIATDTALRRQAKALDQFFADACVNARLGGLLLHPEQNDLDEVRPTDLIQPLEPKTEVQGLIERVLAARDFFLIQGPPGTGKTTVIAEVMAQILRATPDARILLTSQANEAVDHALTQLAQLAKGLNADWRLLRDVSARRADRSSAEGFEATFAAWVARVRARSNAALEARLPQMPPEQGEAVRKVIANWQARLDRAEDVADNYAEHVQVHGVTCLRVPTLWHRLRDVTFDWVIVDEAARATPAEVMVSLVVGRRFILVGDHRQLPPFLDTETQRDIEAEGIDVAQAKRSLFEDIFEKIPKSNRQTLRRQFRMHRSIGDLVGQLFYAEDGGLETGVADTQRELALAKFDRSHRVFWVDVDGREAPVGTSWTNAAEVDAIHRLLLDVDEELRARGVRYTVGVIAAYAAQAERLRAKLVPRAKAWSHVDLRVDTVDAFQGRERDIIICSLVRTGEHEMRFLSDRQRLNVAFSRAKRLLVLVGRRASAQRSARLAEALRLIPRENFLAPGPTR